MAQAKTLTPAELDQVLDFISHRSFALRNRVMLLTGMWSGSFLSGYSGTVQVLANGQVSGITNGCNFSGSFSPRSSGKNVFDFSLVNGTGCILPGFKSSGIAISYLTSTGKRQLIAGSTDASKAQGDLFFAQR